MLHVLCMSVIKGQTNNNQIVKVPTQENNNLIDEYYMCPCPNKKITFRKYLSQLGFHHADRL